MVFQTCLPPWPYLREVWILEPEYVSTYDSATHKWVSDQNDISTRIHPNGWTITGQLHDDYFTWVLEFVAFHNDHGMVYGNINTDIYASSEETWLVFNREFPAGHLDYDEI